MGLADLPVAVFHEAHSKYPTEVKLAVISSYFVSRDARLVAEASGLSTDTVKRWMNNTTWWPIAWKELQREDKELSLGKWKTIQRKAIDKVIERLDVGDEVVSVSKEGDVTVAHKAISARDSAAIAKVSAERVEELETVASEEVEDSAWDTRLKQLATMFDDKFNALQEKVTADSEQRKNEKALITEVEVDEDTPEDAMKRHIAVHKEMRSKGRKSND